MDTISDFIIQIKNAGAGGKEAALIPYSNLKKAIADVLEKEGFVKVSIKKGKKAHKFLEVKPVYEGKIAKISGVKRVSKPSKRIYIASGDAKSVKGGFGKLIVSTSKGIMTERQARKENVGGEALFEIW